MATKTASTKRKAAKTDCFDLPGLDDNLDLPSFDESLDFPGLDAILADLSELPGFEFDLEALDLEPAILRPQKNVRARVVGNENDGATKSKPLCGAKTRSGKPCKAPGLGRGRRCKLHGGKSTGPKTPEGKTRSLAALRGGRI
jgi:hypothetical protein